MKKPDLKVVQVADKTKVVRGPYKKTKLNAMRHGLSSNCEVLPWEDPRDLIALKERLIEEHKPGGILEAQVVDDIAMIIFRKQRLYRAETALIVSNLRHEGEAYSLHKDANLLAADIDIQEPKRDSFKSVLYASAEDDEQEKASCQEEINLHQSLANQKDLSYEELIAKLPEVAAKAWDEWLREEWVDKDDEPYKKTADSLRQFLQEQGIDSWVADKNLIESKAYLRHQAIGMSYNPTQSLETLQRYETALDKSLSKKIDLLLKLQERRGYPGNGMEA